MRHIAGYVIDDDPARIDAGAAAAFLTTQAYWAGGAARRTSGARSPKPGAW